MDIFGVCRLDITHLGSSWQFSPVMWGSWCWRACAYLIMFQNMFSTLFVPTFGTCIPVSYSISNLYWRICMTVFKIISWMVSMVLFQSDPTSEEVGQGAGNGDGTGSCEKLLAVILSRHGMRGAWTKLANFWYIYIYIDIDIYA